MRYQLTFVMSLEAAFSLSYSWCCYRPIPQGNYLPKTVVVHKANRKRPICIMVWLSVTPIKGMKTNLVFVSIIQTLPKIAK